jgi:hypothetical protein
LLHEEEPSSINSPQQYQEEEPSPISWHHQSSSQFYGQLYSFLSHNEANMQLLEYIAKLDAHKEEASPIYWHQHYKEEERQGQSVANPNGVLKWLR